MIIYEITGREDLEIKNIVFDYNGTIAKDGKLIGGVKELINSLTEKTDIFILTADTYGTVEKECKDIQARLLTFPRENAGESKREIVEKLGGNNTLCIGNGYNDIAMFKEAIISIAVMEAEGVSAKLLIEADLVVRSIIEGINILLNKNMMKATLRN